MTARAVACPKCKKKIGTVDVQTVETLHQTVTALGESSGFVQVGVTVTDSDTEAAVPAPVVNLPHDCTA